MPYPREQTYIQSRVCSRKVSREKAIVVRLAWRGKRPGCNRVVLGSELEDEPVAVGRRHGLGREREVGLRNDGVVGGVYRGNCER